MAHRPLSFNASVNSNSIIVESVDQALETSANATGILNSLQGLVNDTVSQEIADTISLLKPFIEKITAASQGSKSVIEDFEKAVRDYNIRADNYLATVTFPDAEPEDVTDPTDDSLFRSVNATAKSIVDEVTRTYRFSGTVREILLEIDPAPPLSANISSSKGIDIRDIVVRAAKDLSIASGAETRAVLTESSGGLGSPTFDALAELLTDINDRLDPINAVKTKTSTPETSEAIAVYKEEIEIGLETVTKGVNFLDNTINGLIDQLNSLTF